MKLHSIEDPSSPTATMSKGMGDSWMRNDSDIFWMREVLQQMALPYRWSQDIRYIEVEFDADLYIYREDIYADVEELSINSGVRGCIPFIEVCIHQLMNLRARARAASCRLHIL